MGTSHGNGLTRNSSGDTRPQSPQLAEPLWTYSGLKTERYRCARADPYLKKKEEKKSAGANESSPFPKLLTFLEKATTIPARGED